MRGELSIKLLFCFVPDLVLKLVWVIKLVVWNLHQKARIRQRCLHEGSDASYTTSQNEHAKQNLEGNDQVSIQPNVDY